MVGFLIISSSQFHFNTLINTITYKDMNFGITYAVVNPQEGGTNGLVNNHSDYNNSRRITNL